MSVFDKELKNIILETCMVLGIVHIARESNGSPQ